MKTINVVAALIVHDGKLIDHIYMDRSLIGSDSNIYYIGDSKYYSDSHEIEGVPLYKQFTYARNAIQYNIDQYYIKNKANPNSIRYRDKDTEGYNVTPNFFVRPKIQSDNLDFDTPSFSASTNQPKPNKHFEDRLFDIPFLNYFHNLLAGKVYKETDNSTDLILAFEKKTEQGKLDLKEVQEDLQHAITGGSITDPIELKP